MQQRAEKKKRNRVVESNTEQVEGELIALLAPARIDTCLHVDQALDGRSVLGKGKGYPPPSSELPNPGFSSSAPLRPLCFSLIQIATGQLS